MLYMPGEYATGEFQKQDVDSPLWHYGFKLGTRQAMQRVQAMAKREGSSAKTFEDFQTFLGLSVGEDTHLTGVLWKLYEDYGKVWLQFQCKYILGGTASDRCPVWVNAWEGGKNVEVLAVANSRDYCHNNDQRMSRVKKLLYGNKAKEAAMWYLDAENFTWKRK